MSININKKIKKLGMNDDVYILTNSFLGNLIKKGNSVRAYKFFISILAFFKEKNMDEKEALFFFEETLTKLKPVIGVRPKKVAGIIYQLPCSLSDVRSSKIAINWFFKSLLQRSELTLLNRIRAEFLEINNNRGHSIQKKKQHEKLIIENRPFLHFLKR